MSLLISGLTSLASLLFNAASNGAGKGAAGRRPSGSPDGGPSATVRLSQEAQTLAGLAGHGAMFAPAVAATGAPAVSAGAGKPIAQVSREDFQALLGRFGADAEQQKVLTAGFDADQNGVISQSEFLQGLGRTARGGGADGFSQALLGLMDGGGGGDGNASVSKQEFTAFTTAFAAATRERQA